MKVEDMEKELERTNKKLAVVLVIFAIFFIAFVCQLWTLNNNKQQLKVLVEINEKYQIEEVK